MLRYLFAWLALLVLAVANGALRHLTFGRSLPELRAHQLSTLIGSVVIGLFIWFVVRVWPPKSGRQALAIGLAWLSLTVAFEFTFGRLVAHRSWPELFNDYNLAAGRVWLLFLVWLVFAPYLFLRMRQAR